MSENDRPTPLPLPTIRRYPIYLREIRAEIENGEEHISSAVLADRLGLDPVLTRKDLAMVGVPGKPRRGYPAKELESAMTHALGWDNATDAALVGVGSLGQALLGYAGFAEHNLSIAVSFDADDRKVGTEVHGIKVCPLDEIPSLVSRLNLKLGILTVPKHAAQGCANALIEAGIIGIWNFTGVHLEVPPTVIVQDVDLAQSLAVLSHAIVQS